MFSIGLYDLAPTKRKILLEDMDGKQQDRGFSFVLRLTIIILNYVLTTILV